MFLSLASSRAAPSGDMPRPFCSTGLVATTQNSKRFLWNDMKDEAAARQNLKCPRGGLVLGVTNLDRAQKCAGID